MKRSMVVGLLLLLVVGVASAQVVSGTVYALSSNAATFRMPIAGAIVTLTRINPVSTLPNLTYQTVSGNDGSYRFLFNAPLPSGTYSLLATARGYVQLNRITFVVDNSRPNIGIYRNDILMVPVRPVPTNVSP
ncbi:MAG: carboxypeptidase-like regulatory domain-containing protein [bacterium]|nr:carboxypeptidase-like regulatory domain-containing protein [bacterium]